MTVILLIAAAVIFAEIIIKRRVEENGGGSCGEALGGLIRREKVYNPGLMLGFLKKNRLFACILSGAALLGAAVYAVWRCIRGMAFGAKLGWGLLLGGGISNLLERIRHGYVTDYFSFCRAVPKKLRRLVFNIADLCIFIGAVLAAVFDA